MTSLFDKRDRWGNPISLWIFAGLLFGLPLIGLALSGIRMTNDVESWLPKHDHDARVLAWFKQHFPAEDRVFVTWDDSSLDDPRVGAYVTELIGTVDEDGVRRNGSPLIDSVVTAAGLYERMLDYGVEPDEALDRLNGTLIGSRRIRVRLSAAGRAHRELAIRKLASLAAGELGVTLTVMPADDSSAEPAGAIPSEPLAASGEAFGTSTHDSDDPPLESPGPRDATHDLQLSWAGMEPRSKDVARFCRLAGDLRSEPTEANPDGLLLIDACFQSPGSPVGMLVTLSEAGRADEAAVVAALRSAAVKIGIAEETLRLGGRAVTASELNEAVKRSVWNASIRSWWPHQRSVMLLSGGVGVVLAFVFLRSVRLGILVLAVSYYSTLISTALVPLAGDSLNMVLMVMPTLLNVLTLSGAIHVANYWKHAALEDPRTAIGRAIEMARQPCALASVTTAIGLISLLTSDLGPVRQFGLYSAIGCLIALAMVLYVLPALLQLWPATAPGRRELDSRIWRVFGSGLARHGAATASICLVLFVVCSYGLVYFRTETKVIRYFPPNARVVRDSEAIEQSLAGISSIETVVRFSRQMQQDTSFLERLEIVRDVGRAIREHPQISGVISLADFQPVIEPPPADAGTFAKIKYNRRSSEVERRIKSSSEEGTAAFLAVTGQSADLAAPGDAGLNSAGDELWRITGQASMISDTNFRHLTDEIDARVAAAVAAYPGAEHVVTGTVPLFLRTQMAVLESLISSFGLAFAIIALVMIVQLRSITAGLLSMLPNLMPVGTVFGLLAWCGERVDVGSMVTASVALGIAVDGTLHLLTWFQDGVRRGMTRREAVVESLAHCGPAMWQTSAAVGFALLMLFPAELLMISRFGWLMAALIGAALFGDLVFLPALLTGPLGYLIERSVRRTAVAAAVAPTAAAVPPTSQPHFRRTSRSVQTAQRGPW